MVLTRYRFWKDLKQFGKDLVCISEAHQREVFITLCMKS